jgi:hypothetical protein
MKIPSLHLFSALRGENLTLWFLEGGMRANIYPLMVIIMAIWLNK